MHDKLVAWQVARIDVALNTHRATNHRATVSLESEA